MKLEDLKKRCKEEKRDLSPVKVINKYLLLPLILTVNIESQILINGFYKYDLLKTVPGYEKILDFDFNKDQVNDLLLYNIHDKQFGLISFDTLGNVNQEINKFFYYNLRDIKPLPKIKSDEDLYVFVSRKNMLAGLASFTKYGTLQLLTTVEFDSYPSNVNTADLNNDGNYEAIVTGSAFNGMVLLTENKFVLSKNFISENKLYESASFIDYNYDGLTDIAAVDVLNNSIVFFTNYDSLYFSQERSIEFPEKVFNLNSLDFNRDSYTDLIFSKNSSIQILLGDSVSSFYRRRTIQTGGIPQKYVVADFNNDGLNDLAYILKEKGELYIAYQLTDLTFSDPILLLHKSGLVDLIMINHSNAMNLVSLDLNGRLHILTNRHDVSGFFKLASIGSSLSVGTLKQGDNSLLFYIDNYLPSLKIYYGANLDFFEMLYSIDLLNNYNHVKAFEVNETTVLFLCYSINSFQSELIQINFNNSTITKIPFYHDGSIVDAKKTKLVLDETLQPVIHIKLLSKKSTYLIDAEYKLKDNKIIAVKPDTLFHTLTGCYSQSDSINLYYVVRKKDNYIFKKKYSDSQKENLPFYTVPVTEMKGLDIKPVANKKFEREEIVFAIKDSSRRQFLYLDNNNKMIEYDSTITSVLGNTSRNNMFEKLRIQVNYADRNQELGKINAYLNNDIESKTGYRYFASEFSDNSLYMVVYSNQQNHITFQRIE